MLRTLQSRLYLTSNLIARRNFSILNYLSKINGVDNIGVSNALIPPNISHVAPTSHLLNFSGISLSVFYSCDSILSLCTNNLGLEAGSSILATPMLIKTLFMPISLAAQRYGSLKGLDAAEITKLQESIKRKQMNPEDDTINDDKAKLKYLREKPMFSLPGVLRFFEYPLHFFALANISNWLITKCTAAGAFKFLWMSNILLPDPFFILPALTAATSIWLMKRNLQSKSTVDNPLVKSMGKTIYFVPLISMFPLMAVPAYYCLYSTGTIAMTILINEIGNSKKFQKFMWGERKDLYKNWEDEEIRWENYERKWERILRRRERYERKYGRLVDTRNKEREEKGLPPISELSSEEREREESKIQNMITQDENPNVSSGIEDSVSEGERNRIRDEKKMQREKEEKKPKTLKERYEAIKENICDLFYIKRDDK